MNATSIAARQARQAAPRREWIVGVTRIGTYVLKRFLGKDATSPYQFWECIGCLTERRVQKINTRDLIKRPCPVCKHRAAEGQAAE
jgi:hypothetical protein